MPKRAQCARFSGECTSAQLVRTFGHTPHHIIICARLTKPTVYKHIDFPQPSPITLSPEPCALRMFRHQSNFLSAPQSVSSNCLETDCAAILQWKVLTRNTAGSEWLPESAHSTTTVLKVGGHQNNSNFNTNSGRKPANPRWSAGRSEFLSEFAVPQANPTQPMIKSRQLELPTANSAPAGRGARARAAGSSAVPGYQ
eukprot:COSAG02_NODE_246_length_27291_cov_105.654200_2_plen_198_part_00